MPSLLSRYATPLTTGLFLLSLISGFALFFHLGTNYFRDMHEWLSLVLLLPFILHVWRNWRPFVNYFRRLPMHLSLVLCLTAGLAFAIPAMNNTGGSSPVSALFGAVETGTLTEVAPLFGHSPQSLAQALQASGYVVASTDTRLSDIAAASGRSGRQVVIDVVAVRKD